MGTVTRLEGMLRAREKIRDEEAALSLHRFLPVSPQSREMRISQFLAKAEELRTIAEDVLLSETRQTLLGLAQSYEYMAHALKTMQTPEQ